jgi:hypothetical protein
MDTAVRRIVAKAIHERYRAGKRKDSRKGDPAAAPWEKLHAMFSESSLQQANDILNKLRTVGYTVKKVEGREAIKMRFTKNQIEIMAELEHARWTKERLGDGWKQGKKRNGKNKISPYLVPWARLSEHAKEQDRKMVRQIPELLAQVGLEIHEA